MRKRFLLALTIFVVFFLSQGHAQKQKTLPQYTISWVNQVVIDKKNGNSIENYAAVFSKKEDSLIIYSWKPKALADFEKVVFWGERSKKQDAIRFLNTNGEAINVSFLKENKIRIDSDLYVLNTSYYTFMKQKLLDEKSILDFAFFAKDGYGDYANYLSPLLQKNWRNQKENPDHKIIEVIVKNKNEQTDDQFHNWKAVYKYKMNGELESITGEYYTRKYTGQTRRHINYLIEENLDRSAVRTSVYHNKKTLMDSLAVDWTQFSTSGEFHYNQYQTKLKVIHANKKPENFSAIARLLNIR